MAVVTPVIAGVGVDAVEVSRLEQALGRTPRLAQRVFTPHELQVSTERASRSRSLAARFAAKEAVRKALRRTIAWRDVEVVSAPDRSVGLRVAGYEDRRFHLSLTHTAGLAMAFVVVEDGPDR